MEDPFAALASVDVDHLTMAFSGPFERHVVAIERLLPTAPPGGRHLGIGTNFPEHAEEAHSESVFFFPKFGTATPARTTVAAREGGLLDYEVELCMRFDRPIRSLDDFDAAVKGLMDIAIPVFIENERASGHFLKPGDTVIYRASMLGDIVVEIKP